MSSAPATQALPNAAPAAAQEGAGAHSAATAAALPGGIEIFKAGTHRDDAGRVHVFTTAMLAQMAESYNAQLREAPLTVGHPADNLPAYGWVRRVYLNDAGNLAVDVDQVDPQFAEMVRRGRFKKRSASFYPPGAPHNPTPGKWYLRHVAFLGAQPPAVAGLKDIGFAQMGGAAEAVSFSETDPNAGACAPVNFATQLNEEPPMSDADKAELERLRAADKANQDALADAQAQIKAATDAAEALRVQVASFAEQRAAERRAGFLGFSEAEVRAGRVLPKDKQMLVATLETLAASQAPVSFSEGGTTTTVEPAQMTAWLQGQISSRPAAVQFGEMSGAHGAAAGEFDARGKSDDEINRAALAWQAEHPERNYSEALAHVTRFAA